LYDKLNNLTGANQTRNYGPAQPGEQQRSCIDSSKAKSRLKWQPEIELKEGLKRTIDWFKSSR